MDPTYVYAPNNASSSPGYTLIITNVGSSNGRAITNLNNTPVAVMGGVLLLVQDGRSQTTKYYKMRPR